MNLHRRRAEDEPRAERRALCVGGLALWRDWRRPGKISIAVAGGEAGEFPEAEVEQVLRRYFRRKF